MLFRKLTFDIIINNQVFQFTCNEGVPIKDVLQATKSLESELVNRLEDGEPKTEAENVE